jgi:hypothetical protein
MGMELMTYSGFTVIHKFIHLLFFLIYVKKTLSNSYYRMKGVNDNGWRWISLQIDGIKLLTPTPYNCPLHTYPTPHILNNFLYKL